MSDGPISQQEMIGMFGEAMPIEAVNLLANSADHTTLRELRRKLREIAATRTEPSTITEEGLVERVAAFQAGVDAWMDACFGEAIKADVQERCDRFVEEALEFVQAAGYSAERAHALVDYTFGRPEGEINQEVGGVMVTLAAMCNTLGVSIGVAAETELARVWTKVDAIRAKQAAKPTGSALPVAAASGHTALLSQIGVLREALAPFAEAWGRSERKPEHVLARELTFADYERARAALSRPLPEQSAG